ncbi:hypothetical protein SBDP1_1170004 [Syntrophobacter sp. SbD1]|nr:hypothetical protein SBDP1_1170004 [Syntrophobacter sp. SbD1]
MAFLHLWTFFDFFENAGKPLGEKDEQKDSYFRHDSQGWGTGPGGETQQETKARNRSAA